MKNLVKENCSLSLAMCAVALGIFTLSQGAEANEVTEKKEVVVHEGGMGFEARIGVGYLKGEANEWVYNAEENYPVSKLTWTLDPVLMIGGGITFRPLSWLELNADVWTKASDSSVMDDWDWIYSGERRPEWTDWSHDKEVTVEDGLIIDLNASIPVYRTPELTVHGIIGYLHDHWSWDATHGGTRYTYSTDASNGLFRDYSGITEYDGTGIIYEQTFDTPYLGIGLGADFSPITVNAKIIGSTFVSADDYDHHSSRKIKFYGDYSGETMIGLTGEVVYDLTESLSLGAAVNYVRYSTMTGDTEINAYEEGATGNDPDGCGTELHRTSVNLSLAYRF